jgi:hypothetical protein
VSPAGAIAIEDLHEAAGAADAEELWTLHARFAILFVAWLGWAEWQKMLGSALIGPRMRYGEGNLNSGDHKPMTQLAGVFRSHFPGVLSESL